MNHAGSTAHRDTDIVLNFVPHQQSATLPVRRHACPLAQSFMLDPTCNVSAENSQTLLVLWHHRDQPGSIASLAKCLRQPSCKATHADSTCTHNSSGSFGCEQVVPSLAIHDTMRYVKSDVSTLAFGGAMGMMGFLLAVGAKVQPASPVSHQQWCG